MDWIQSWRLCSCNKKHLTFQMGKHLSHAYFSSFRVYLFSFLFDDKIVEVSVDLSVSEGHFHTFWICLCFSSSEKSWRVSPIKLPPISNLDTFFELLNASSSSVFSLWLFFHPTHVGLNILQKLVLFTFIWLDSPCLSTVVDTIDLTIFLNRFLTSVVIDGLVSL